MQGCGESSEVAVGTMLPSGVISLSIIAADTLLLG
jgi:hypothetical protein